jgi:RND superfamily putative drug exporter
VEARNGFELLKKAFPDEGETRFTVAVRFPSGPVWTAERVGALYDLSARLASLPGVRKVKSVAYGDPRLSRELYQELLTAPPPAFAPLLEAAKAQASKDGVVVLQAVTGAAPQSEEAHDIVRAIRSQRAVGDGTLLVGGESATELDVTNYLTSRIPAAVAFVMLTTFVIVALLLGSLVLAFKAVVMNSLSIVGSFGAMVFLFQEGHGGLVDVPRPLEPTLPVLLFCILFGLSMDYEVLILTRVKEVWSRTQDNVRAVGEGLERTAGVVTSAAAIMIAVFLSFGLSHVVVIKAVGVGMGVAVALDATLVRVLLVPAAMRLLGKANWWEPKWLHALRVALGLEPKGAAPRPSPKKAPPAQPLVPHA